MKDENKKIRTTLTINEDIFKEMKEKIPNISKFLEESAKAHLRADGKPESVIRQQIVSKQQQIFELEDEIGFLEAQLKNLTGHNQTIKEKQDYAWRKLLSYYKETGYTHPKLIKEALKVLDTTERILEDTLPVVRDNITPHNGVEMRQWDHVKENYLQVSRLG